ncbi:MAG: hypothetical protein J6Y57_07580 [Lachnospiraceae bacterium]|nr:hypothetical protein [Lachnospiraceae bacterium]
MAELTNYDDFLGAEKTSTLKETDRKCPDCGGVMDFDPATGGLHCPYCDHKEEIKRAEDKPERAQELDFASAELTGNCDWGVAQKTVTCKSCGATSVYDALEVANECPYCGSNQVMEANDVSTLAPNGVVPFRITVKQAGENFTSWLKHKWFCPREAKENAKADQFQGVYLPYWTFDADTDTNYTAQYGIERRVKDGDDERTVTDWYSTNGRYQHFIDDELVLASNHHDSSILRMIEPFDTADNKTYKPEYIAGYAAERYSLGLKDAWEKAKQYIKNRLSNLIESKIRSDHNADSVRNLAMHTTYSNITYKYLMLPIYISSFRYKDKVYQFMVNGQSGKVGGRSPISALRVALFILICIAIAMFLYWITN